jgi:hypothetical protein
MSSVFTLTERQPRGFQARACDSKKSCFFMFPVLHICTPPVMARNVLVDAGFVVALLSSRDAHHEWDVTQASEKPPPWSTCEPVLSEAFHLLGERGAPNLGALLRRRAVLIALTLAQNVGPVGLRFGQFLARSSLACDSSGRWESASQFLRSCA